MMCRSGGESFRSRRAAAQFVEEMEQEDNLRCGASPFNVSSATIAARRLAHCPSQSSQFRIGQTAVISCVSSGTRITMIQIVFDQHLLDEIVHRLVHALDPDRIILFGSRARGDARPDSDIDLLIVKDTSLPVYQRAIPAYRALSGMGIPKDIIWRTPAEVKDWSEVPTYITTRAIKEGKILYEKRS
jgi:predicted nucleotidyltransferase